MSTKSRSLGLVNVAMSVALMATAGLLAGCNKSASAKSSGAAASATIPAAAASAAKVLGGGGGGGSLDVSKQCKAIKPADIQALMKTTLSPVMINPLECSYDGGALKVNIRLDDTSHKEYTLLATPDPTHTVSGVGDAAFWFEPYAGRTTPWLEAYKGSVACEVSSADPENTTLVYTGNPPIVTIADADAVAYAAKEGAVCSDVFSAS